MDAAQRLDAVVCRTGRKRGGRGKWDSQLDQLVLRVTQVGLVQVKSGQLRVRRSSENSMQVKPRLSQDPMVLENGVWFAF